jgi:hypothetical protein
MTTLLYFLGKNGKWLRADPYELYKFTMWIAESPAPAKAGALKATEDFLKLHI